MRLDPKLSDQLREFADRLDEVIASSPEELQASEMVALLEDVSRASQRALGNLIVVKRMMGQSWADLGREFGVSRQAAWERFGRAERAYLFSGKVRDIYEVDDRHLLLYATDRMSAFDVVLDQPVLQKGRVLTALTAFWSEALRDVATTHLVTVDPALLPDDAKQLPDYQGRTTLVRRAEMIAIECIVRGYISGSAWKEYKASGTIHGTAAPKGLKESDQLPEPIFTPSTKAEGTAHDENITFAQAADIVGKKVAEEAREISLEYYRRGAELARERGVIIADTKFELGFIDGKLCVCDEIMTPDSSRFWDLDTWKPGSTPPSLDKQPLRDWLESTGWDKTPPAPKVPRDVLQQSTDRYIAAYERITGTPFSEWYGVSP
jgi:phosphoribosylaminoimidazole-succinocarboxamide synthase